MTTASRLLLSYPAALSDRERQSIEDSTFRTYLRRVHDRASEGDTWAEFVGCGCGSTRDVPLRVERVEGGERVTAETEIEYVERESREVAGD